MAGEQFDRNTVDQLTGLLRLALGLQGDCPAINPQEWEKVCFLARRQTVSGLLDSAVRLLPESMLPPQDLIVDIMMEAERISKRSSTVNLAAKTLIESIASVGLHPTIMKGPSVARYYPHPDLRVSGDIDIHIPENEKDLLLSHLRKEGGTPLPTPDGSYFCQAFRFKDIKGLALDIDIHTAYYDLHCPESSLPPVGTPEAELLMLSSHILKHAMGPGVGLRQLCDMAVAYRALEGKYDKEALLSYFRSTGTLHWNEVLCGFLKSHFNLDTGLFEDKQSFTLGRDIGELEEIIFSGGNFGHFKEGRSRALKAPSLVRKADTALRFLRKLPFSIRCAPHEFRKYVSSLIRGNIQ